MRIAGLLDILLAVLPVLPDVALLFALQLAERLLFVTDEPPGGSSSRRASWLRTVAARLANATQAAKDEATAGDDAAQIALRMLAPPLHRLVDRLLSSSSSLEVTVEERRRVSQVLLHAQIASSIGSAAAGACPTGLEAETIPAGQLD